VSALDYLSEQTDFLSYYEKHVERKIAEHCVNEKDMESISFSLQEHTLP
jgi:hypothetical protein